VSDERLHVTTEEQRELFHAARRSGEQCAACGRAFSADETVYIQRFAVPLIHYPSTGVGPVGAECASPELLRRVEGSEPERCAGCGRPVYYRRVRTNRQRPTCSRRCSGHLDRARRRKVKG
jgi:hypothetical protein